MEFKLQKELRLDVNNRHLVDFLPDLPVVIDYLQFHEHFPLTPNYHDYLEIAYACHGGGWFPIGSRRYEIKPGDLFVIGSHELHTIEAYPGRPVSFMVLYFLPELIYRPGNDLLDMTYLWPYYCQGEGFEHRIPAHYIVVRKIYRHMRAMDRALQTSPRFFAVNVKTYLCEILLLLLDYYQDVLSPYAQRDDMQQRNIERLKRVFQYLHRYYSQRITLRELADIANMSPPYFSKFFKRVTGHTFSDYLLRMRIDKARELLIKGHANCSEVATQVGFDNYSHFYRVFKRFTHTSPQAFHQQNFRHSNKTVASAKDRAKRSSARRPKQAM